MIRSTLLEIIDEVDATGYAIDNTVEISIPKEKFPEYIKSFKIEKYNLPSEEEAKKVYDELIDQTGFVNFDLAVSTLADWIEPGIYSLVGDNEFFYVGDFDRGCSFNFGLCDYYVRVLECAYYLAFYKRSFYRRCWYRKVEECLTKEFLDQLKKSLQRFKCFIARITLYREAFIKLNMKDDLEKCEKDYNKALRIYSLGLFSCIVIEKLMKN